MEMVMYRDYRTVDNHGNTEVTETVILPKIRIFPKFHSFMFSQEYFVFSQHNLKFIA